MTMWIHGTPRHGRSNLNCTCSCMPVQMMIYHPKHASATGVQVEAEGGALISLWAHHPCAASSTLAAYQSLLCSLTWHNSCCGKPSWTKNAVSPNSCRGNICIYIYELGDVQIKKHAYIQYAYIYICVVFFFKAEGPQQWFPSGLSYLTLVRYVGPSTWLP